MKLSRHTDTITRLLAVGVALLTVTSMIAVGGAVAQDDGPPEPPHRVFGDVADENGDPIENATVTVEFDGETITSDTTNGDGYYDVKVDGLDTGDEMTLSVVEEGGVENATSEALAYESAGSDRVDLSVEFDEAEDPGTGTGPGSGPSVSPSPSPGDGDDDTPVPTAVISIEPDPATVGEVVTFSAADSVDDERDIVTYEWEIAGEKYTNETVTVSFDEPGIYDVELTVSNDFGESDTASDTVTVEEEKEEKKGGTSPEDDDDEDDEDPATDEETDDDDDLLPIPGFGVTVALVALLATALIALRTQE